MSAPMSDPLDLDPIRAREKASEEAVSLFRAEHPDRSAEYQLRHILHLALYCDRPTWESYRGVIQRSAELGIEAGEREHAAVLAEVDRLRDVIGRAREEAAAYEDRGFTFSTRHLASTVRAILSEVD